MHCSASIRSFDDNTKPRKRSAFRTVNRHSKRKIPSKNISFNKSVRVLPIQVKASKMTKEERSQVYYSKEDMVGFQQECKDICKHAVVKARTLSRSNSVVSPTKSLSLMLQSDSNLRGFEAQICPLRKSNKQMVHQAFHSYQKQLKALESTLSQQEREMLLASAYSSLSHCSKSIAIIIAQKDFTENTKGYDVATSPVPCSLSSRRTNSIPNVGSKRSLEYPTESFQTKRCRTSKAA